MPQQLPRAHVSSRAKGLTETLSTVDGRNLASVVVERYGPSRSRFIIGACVVVPGVGGANGQNLAPPRVQPNIELGGKGGEGHGRRTTDSY